MTQKNAFYTFSSRLHELRAINHSLEISSSSRRSASRFVQDHSDMLLEIVKNVVVFGWNCIFICVSVLIIELKVYSFGDDALVDN